MCRAFGKSRKRRKKAFFLRYPQICLNPHLLNPHLRHPKRKKHPKKICIKNFGGTLAGGSRRGLRRPNSLSRCWFSQQNTVHKEFRGGGGSKGVLGGWGQRSNLNLGPHLFMFMCFSSGPEKGVITKGVFSLEESLESLI